jgi:exportin-1
MSLAGEMVTKQPLIRSMRTVKRETLKLISGWVSRSNDPQMVSNSSAALCLSTLDLDNDQPLESSESADGNKKYT